MREGAFAESIAAINETAELEVKDKKYDFEIFNDPKTFKDVCRKNKFNQLIKNHNL